MAGKGKFKIGAEVGYKDNLGIPLRCGDHVRHIITGKEGLITQYGVVKGEDGTNYKLCDNFWEVVGKPFKENEREEPIDITINVDSNEEAAEKCLEEIGRIKEAEAKNSEKTLADLDNCDIIGEAVSRGLLKVFLESNYEDAELAEELRNRGYEVKAEKTIVVSI